jgi:hypothetical protein
MASDGRVLAQQVNTSGSESASWVSMIKKEANVRRIFTVLVFFSNWLHIFS